MDNKRDLNESSFGQPRGLATLLYTVMWERFSYYEMRAILIFYMYYTLEEGGLGMSQTLAASIMSIYGSLVYTSTIAGGWLEDRVWGPRRTTFIGEVLVMLGHICLSVPFGAAALYLSIVSIVMGSGLLNPASSAVVGDSYEGNDNRYDAGFSLFVFGISLGAVITPIAVPWAASGFGLHLFGDEANFHAEFSLAITGMFFGLVQYWFDGKKYLGEKNFKPNDPLNESEKQKLIKQVLLGLLSLVLVLAIMFFMGSLNIDGIINLVTVIAIAMPVIYFVMMLRSDKVTEVEKYRVLAYIPLFIAAAIFWGIEESGSTVLALFAVDRTVLRLGAWHFEAANFQVLNPLFTMILTPVFAALWNNWKKQPSAPGKFSGALIFAGLSYVWIAIPAFISPDHRVSPLWLVGSWSLVKIGEILNSPIGLSVTTRLAPKAFKSQMMSPWYMADSVGQAVIAQTVKLYTPKTEVQYFLAVGVVSIAFGITLMFLVKRIHSLTEGID